MELIGQNTSTSPTSSNGVTTSVQILPETEAPSTQPVVGIIYPPPEVRNIVDKTASFVARNGPEFESRIEQNETGNPKFNFLNPSDPYHAYYQQKVKEFQSGKVQETRSHNKIVLTASQQQKQQEILKQVAEPFVPKGAPPEFEFIADPPSISALDLDIVKLTAQFVSRNGRQFLTNLMNREQRSYQFDFLRPQHSLFQYFTRLLEQYTKVLIPPKELMWKLKEESDSMKHILDMVKYRAEWIKYQEAQQRKEEEELEKERVAYAQIDWHDFVVVETVDYQPFDHGNFPPPTTPDEVGARVLMQERIEDGKEMLIENEADKVVEGDEVDMEVTKLNDENQIPKEIADNNQVQDMDEVSSDDETSSNISTTQIPKKIQGIVTTGFSSSNEYVSQTTQPLPDKVIIKKGYDPKLASKTTRVPATDEVLISPITGEKIPASKVQEHMRIGLLDPRWVEQRDKHIQDKLNQETVYAPGSAIEASLKQLAERRTDIFGVGEETAIGKKIGEEDKQRDGKVTWDGHTSSVEAATRAARANITLEEQIYQIHKVKGLLPDEEKEKIGPKPAGTRNLISVLPTLSSSSNQTGSPSHSSGASNPPIPGVNKQAAALLHQNPLVLTSISKQIATPVAVQPSQPPFPPQSLTIPPMPPPPTILAPQPSMMMMNVHHQHMIASTSYSVTSAPPMQFMQQLSPQMQHVSPQSVQVAVKHSMDSISSTDEEPQSKKALRTEESLIPEETFLSTYNRGTVNFSISVPYIADKLEWKARGQVLPLTLPLTDTVAVVKAKIHDETGMPPGKQKLLCEGLFLKDANSLAYYNIVPGTIIYLQLKERGGRKK